MTHPHFMSEIHAAQALGTAALDYAQRSIAPQGPPPIGSIAVAAIERARAIISADDGTSIRSEGEALLDLQTAAVTFTALAAQHNNRSKKANPEVFQQIETKIVEMLERLGPIAHISLVRDDIVAARKLATAAFDYAEQIIVAEESNAPFGSPPVARALGDLHGAAVTFTVQIAISRSLADPKALRRVERQLVSLFAYQGDP